MSFTLQFGTLWFRYCCEIHVDIIEAPRRKACCKSLAVFSQRKASRICGFYLVNHLWSQIGGLLEKVSGQVHQCSLKTVLHVLTNSLTNYIVYKGVSTSTFQMGAQEFATYLALNTSSIHIIFWLNRINIFNTRHFNWLYFVCLLCCL